ncbi:hypothetical protein TSUD_361220 [Trifolium subterraneum]|uniref:Reverse transcriptase zinc-binding domain-containing protein n=1 Tax=Trifolium subterraneum TaxID=3900 RepID=A0A2Z6N4T6_TRISU|nr:hypothetical protein TSUD_361220 [Trifolium subterraneum]
MDKLSHLIMHAVNEGLWKTLRAGRNGMNVSHLMFADDLLLFGEATENQMDCLMNILTKFCSMSGQEVSYEKTSILFSKNVSRHIRNKLVQKSGFRETNHLGKYLGVPLTGNAPRRSDFQYIINQVSAKLARWKVNQLSFAGRVTLAKSVIEATPIYPMMTNRIPKGCLEEINMLQRKFIWGETEGNNKYHAIRWEDVTRPKRFGGLGLRRLDTMNQACLLKLGWKFNSGASDLWCEVLHGKYSCQTISENMVIKAPASSLWKNIVKLSSNLNKYSFWAVGNGYSVDAWTSAWIDAGLRITDLDLAIPEELQNAKVCDLVDSSGEWNWSMMRGWMPVDLLHKISAILPPSDVNGDDQQLGSGTGSKKFSVSDMYSVLCGFDNYYEARSWKLLWKLHVTERVKCFIWLVSHDRLLTNSRKAMMGLCHAMCTFCGNMEETCIHALRDCTIVRNMWLSVVPCESRGLFFGGDLDSWINYNLSSDIDRINGIRWEDFWAAACHCLWSWPNKEQHVDEFSQPVHEVVHILQRCSHYYNACMDRKPVNTIQKRLQWIGWKVPEEGWVKLNTDGACKGLWVVEAS